MACRTSPHGDFRGVLSAIAAQGIVERRLHRNRRADRANAARAYRLVLRPIRDHPRRSRSSELRPSRSSRTTGRRFCRRALIGRCGIRDRIDGLEQNADVVERRFLALEECGIEVGQIVRTKSYYEECVKP